MLSKATIEILEALIQRSDAFYSDGGTIYTFTEAANQAHCKFPREFRERRAAQLSPDEFARFALVLTHVLGNLEASVAEPESCALAETLLQHLQTDLAFTNIGLSAEQDDYSWGATLHLARDKDNRYFSLKLWGSID